MKKHPVDDLFARKLADWQPKASPDLWNRIENQQQKENRRSAGWHWYAAASVLVILLAGYAVWENQSLVLSDKNRELSKASQTQQSKENSLNKTPIPLDSVKLLAEVEEVKTETGAMLKKADSPDHSKQILAKSNMETPLQIQGREPALDRIEVASIQKKETAPETLIPASKGGIASLPPAGALAEISESFVEQEKGRVIIAHVETENVADEEQKSSKFIRILRQLKNAKQGEAIEWDEVGFNPKKLMARADERLKSEEERISKKYQDLKDKTKL